MLQLLTDGVEVTEKYEVVADEYYDAVAHPTCANFREASSALIGAAIERLNRKPRWLEIGAGASLVAPFLANANPTSLVLSDSSPSMLRHSMRWQESGAQFVICDANALPFDRSSFDVVVSSLGDPYNSAAFWSEVARTVGRKGTVLFTTPSFEWASEYRRVRRYSLKESEFLMRNGREVTLPSVILPEQEQIALIKSSGLDVLRVRNISIQSLSLPVSSKLLMGPATRPIVRLFEAVRPD